LALGIAHSAQGFVQWGYSIYHPEATSMASKLALAHSFRDVLTQMLLMPDHAYHQAILSMNETAEATLETVMHTLIPLFLKKQPSEFRFKQHLIEGQPFSIWNRGESAIEALQATADGSVDARVSENADQRRRLLQLSMDISQRSGGKSAEVLAMKSPRDLGLPESTSDIFLHVRLIRDLADGTSELSREQFIEQHEAFTNLSNGDLSSLFDFLDVDKSGTVSFDEMASAMVAMNPVVTSYGSNLRGLLDKVGAMSLERASRGSAHSVPQKNMYANEDAYEVPAREKRLTPEPQHRTETFEAFVPDNVSIVEEASAEPNWSAQASISEEQVTTAELSRHTRQSAPTGASEAP